MVDWGNGGRERERALERKRSVDAFHVDQRLLPQSRESACGLPPSGAINIVHLNSSNMPPFSARFTCQQQSRISGSLDDPSVTRLSRHYSINATKIKADDPLPMVVATDCRDHRSGQAVAKDAGYDNSQQDEQQEAPEHDYGVPCGCEQPGPMSMTRLLAAHAISLAVRIPVIGAPDEQQRYQREDRARRIQEVQTHASRLRSVR